MESIEQRITNAEILWFAPLGIFELAAYFAQSDGSSSALCKRNA